MFYGCIPLFSYMGTNLGQMPAALRLLRLPLEIPAADRGTDYKHITMRLLPPSRKLISTNIWSESKIFFRMGLANLYTSEVFFIFYFRILTALSLMYDSMLKIKYCLH